jgi:hypothetical protein
MALLPVIPPAPRQDCSRCQHIFKCRSRRTAHDKPLSDRNDTINLLVCRIKSRLYLDSSTKALLQLFRPGMVKLVAQAKKRSGSLRIDFDDMLAEMQSFAVESIMQKYRIGELNPVTNFLFDPKSGYLTKWAKWYVTKIVRWEHRNTLMEDPYMENLANDSSDIDDTDHAPPANTWTVEQPLHTAAYEMQEERSLVDDVMEIIEDGVTLNANEYRVIKFSLQNANEGNSIRMVDGLHIHIAQRMRVSRPRATRLYKRAKDKLKVAYSSKAQEA